MDGVKNKNIKMGNQAWRKKPRKFAPKSKLGCKTCKYVVTLHIATERSIVFKELETDVS
ncbi:hypothetical protein PENSUB_11272 [Penicillium subrubescens]|jgi:hypothetical protein|uniref:Uncharacterized protein n=1 Tax=Penicillium subrubescens TaxID=1316194 RepID=A0A1Q5T4Q2_9EURO|nr:hypothetical protein PENSUB_11272 [Penicillium subrubescens]